MSAGGQPALQHHADVDWKPHQALTTHSGSGGLLTRRACGAGVAGDLGEESGPGQQAGPGHDVGGSSASAQGACPAEASMWS